MTNTNQNTNTTDYVVYVKNRRTTVRVGVFNARSKFEAIELAKANEERHGINRSGWNFTAEKAFYI